MLSVFSHRASASMRRAVPGVAAGLSFAALSFAALSFAALGAATAGAAEPSKGSGLSIPAISGDRPDDALFPLGKPPAMIAATGAAQEGTVLWLDDRPFSSPDRITTGAILTTRSLAGMTGFSLSSRIMPAERHIVVGLMLLAAAGMAGFSFSLWRWQLHGLVSEA